MKLVDFVVWAINNKAEVLGDVAGIIGSASVLVASAAKLVDSLVSIFPGLKGADGKLHAAVSWLSGLANNKWLNAVAMNPAQKPNLAPGIPVIESQKQ